MHPTKLNLRQSLLKLIYELAVLELLLEQQKDNYKDAVSSHCENLALLEIQSYLLDIKKKKYAIEHIQELLSQN